MGVERAASSGSGAVTSVASRTGDVVLTKTDVGLANVDNTADTAKPVSTAQAAADALRALLQETVVVGGNTSTAKTIADVTTGTIHTYTMTGNCTFTFPTAGAGKSFTLELTQDGTGSRLATWPGTVKWPAATAPTLATVAAHVDLLVFTCIDGTNWRGVLAAANYSS